MKYYTEGYVKTITMAGKTTTSPKSCPVGQLLLAKPTTITIEAIQPFKFDHDGNNLLFMDKDVQPRDDSGDNKPADEKSGGTKDRNVVRTASIVDAASEFTCETFDAQFLLSLKQSRTRIRFYVDNPNDKSPKITKIIVL